VPTVQVLAVPPHEPGTAPPLQEAVVPPLLPVQLQVPADALYPEAVPAVQVSAVLLQAPLTAFVLLHEAVVPPLLPVQVQLVVVP